MKRPNRQLGQGLLEAVIAMGILSTSIAAALTLATSSLRAEGEAAAMVVAGNLAREGIEAVRSIRDSNWLADAPWDTGLYSGTDYTGTPVFEPTTGLWYINFLPNAVTNASARVWRRVTASGAATVGLFRQHGPLVEPTAGTVASGYYRILQLHPICRNAGVYTVITTGTCPVEKVGVRVRALMRWTRSGSTHNLTVEESLYDWR